MALIQSDIAFQHHEILLKNKPPSMLAASPKGTVPVLVLPTGRVLQQSWEVMLWALSQNDPANWLGNDNCWLQQAAPLATQCDAQFKTALDRYKYADRQPLTAAHYRQQGVVFMQRLEAMLTRKQYLLGNQMSIADIAIMPFIRQFAGVDQGWFDGCQLVALRNWLERLTQSTLFEQAMQKHAVWVF